MVAGDRNTPEVEAPEPESVTAKRANPVVKQLEELDKEYQAVEDEYQQKWAALQAEYEKNSAWAYHKSSISQMKFMIPVSL